MIEITINNIKYKYDKIITVLQACEQANFIIPRFCYHEKLSIAGSCRMCLVEIEKFPKPIASCAMPIAAGMIIYTQTPLVKKAQESVLELLLINHPLDCPICDQAGECDLQDITLNFGSDRSRFFEQKRGVEDKICGPIIKTIMTRCIHCTRCIRFLIELGGTEFMGSTGRGEVMEIGTYLNKFLKTELSGNLIDLCPVGALTSKPYAFVSRNWELKKYDSIDFTDALGSNIIVYVRNKTLIKKTLSGEQLVIPEQILRILPKSNENINEVWISDKTRFAFDGANILRLKHIINNLNVETSYRSIVISFIYKFRKELFEKATLFCGNLGNIVSIEELFFFRQFLNLYGIQNFFFNYLIFNWNTDLINFYYFNNKINSIEKSDLILLIAVNPRKEAAMLNLKIRKHFFNSNILVATISSFLKLTYPIMHLGNSFKTLVQIIEGTHFFCKLLRISKMPLILIGSVIGERLDSFGIQTLINFLNKKAFLLLKDYWGFNFLHSNFGYAHFCELGLKSKLFNKTTKFSALNLNSNEILNFTKKKVLFSESSLISFSGYKFNLENQSNFAFPIHSFFERKGFYINTEGLVQKTIKIQTTFTDARYLENILKIFVLLDTCVKKNFIIKNFTEKRLKKELPCLKNFYERKSFNFNFLKINNNFIKLYFTPIKSNILNFYMSDNISINSKLMAECSLFLKEISYNFLKI